MSRIERLLTVLPRRRTIVLAAIGLAVGGTVAVNADQNRAGGVKCELRVEKSGGMTGLKGLVFATTAVNGTYEMRVSKTGGGGSSVINNNGEFAAAPGRPATLGAVTLGGGGSYAARLRVNWKGGEVECNERVGGWF